MEYIYHVYAEHQNKDFQYDGLIQISNKIGINDYNIIKESIIKHIKQQTNLKININDLIIKSMSLIS